MNIEESQELIVVRQLPVIEEQLKRMSESITEKVEYAKALLCNEETVKLIKNTRSDLNREYTELESKRKQVKNQILKPYEDFENVYKMYISDKFKDADKDLKSKIDSVENQVKTEKSEKIILFFNEYLQSKNIDFVTFEMANINVTLSASPRSLKDAAKTFIDKVCDDVALIETQENSTEIMVEYKRSMNVSQAITTVTARHKAIEDEKKRLEAFEVAKAEEKKSIEIVEAIAPKIEPLNVPIVVEHEYTTHFTVTGTKDKLKALKQFLVDGGYKYE